MCKSITTHLVLTFFIFDRCKNYYYYYYYLVVEWPVLFQEGLNFCSALPSGKTSLLRVRTGHVAKLKGSAPAAWAVTVAPESASGLSLSEKNK